MFVDLIMCEISLCFKLELWWKMECFFLDILLVGILYLFLICEIFECVNKKILKEESKKINDRLRNCFRLGSCRYFMGFMRRICLVWLFRYGSLRYFV